MLIVRFDRGDGVPRVGICERGSLLALPESTTMGGLLSLRLAELKAVCEGSRGSRQSVAEVRLLAPVDGRMEVWAAGVTYENSRLARMQESLQDSSVYARVYDAPRPELFFKAVSWKVSGDREPIGVRLDSAVNVPEPEIGVVGNRHGEVVGLTICNDVSSRSLEAENPLYLPQAKIFAGACAVGPGIRPVWEIRDLADLTLTMVIRRAATVVWEGQTSTARLRRPFDQLIGHLSKADQFSEGLVLSSGTGLVPELPFSLQQDDEVEIGVAEVGRLTNVVQAGGDAFHRSLAETRAAWESM